MTTTFLGIDPGITGAVAALRHDGTIGFYDAPIAKSGGRTVLIPAVMKNILVEEYNHAPDNGIQVALEKVHSMPRDGSMGAFTFGKGVGIWIGILTAIPIPFHEITPQRWQGVMLDGMPKDKDSSRMKALQLFPELTEQLKLKKHHGRADALLLALYLKRLVS